MGSEMCIRDRYCALCLSGSTGNVPEVPALKLDCSDPPTKSDPTSPNTAVQLTATSTTIAITNRRIARPNPPRFRAPVALAWLCAGASSGSGKFHANGAVPNGSQLGGVGMSARVSNPSAAV